MRARGFTLIELVTGIVVLAISLTLITTLLFPQARNSVQAVYQVRAVELGQSLLNEILSKRFDEASNPNGGTPRCSEQATSCTAPPSLGPEELTRAEFDDVDDYNGLTQAGATIESATGSSLGSLYNGFSLTVTVFYDANQDGIDDSASGLYKRIAVTVTTPDGTTVPFVAYRGNY